MKKNLLAIAAFALLLTSCETKLVEKVDLIPLAENVEIHNSKLLSKDAFWNSDHVTVYDSFISGEYLGWNAKNLTLINCTIESLQGMCYIDNLIMKNCKRFGLPSSIMLCSITKPLAPLRPSSKSEPPPETPRCLRFCKVPKITFRP